MVGIFRRRGVKLFLGTVIGVPLVAVVGAAGYVQYRISTRPPEHTFQPLVSATGELQLQGVSIAAPTRWDLTKRVFELLRIFLPLVALYYVVVLLRPARHRWWLRKLKEGVERAGPAFVKAGQWACTRNDLFSREFRDVFKELYSETSVHSFADTERIVEADLGAPLSEVFRSFDPVPVGSGSIGQVHSGVLKDGRRVAVKVMHPGVVETIAKDFFIINNIASWVHNNVPSLEHYNVRKIGLAWTNHLAAQLDFRIEAEHLHLFRKHFNGTDYVRFPEPYRATQHVLIEEFCPGEPATPEFLGAQDPSVRDVLAGKGLNCYCKMLLRDNFIHGDLHPGNILVDARDPANPVVTLIDVGLCQKMTIREGQLTHELMGAFVRWVPGACSSALWNMGDEQLYADKAKFDGDMVDLFKRFRPISGDEVEVVNNVLQAVFDVVRVNRVTMEPTFVSILFAVLVLESFIMALNPEFNMVRHASGWLVSEGHISKKLFKNIAYSAEDIVRSRARMLKARLTGQSEKEDYVPAQRRRMEERMLAEHQERFGAVTPVPVAVAA